MPEDRNDQFVLAFFQSFHSAEEAARQIETWDKKLVDVQLGAIGVIQETKDGKIITHYYGPQNARKGAKVGMLLGILAALFPAVSLGAGLASGAVLGGIAGRLSRKKLGLAEEDLALYQEKLKKGYALLIVACDDFEVAATVDELANLGGKIQVHAFSRRDLEESTQELSVS